MNIKKPLEARLGSYKFLIVWKLGQDIFCHRELRSGLALSLYYHVWPIWLWPNPIWSACIYTVGISCGSITGTGFLRPFISIFSEVLELLSLMEAFGHLFMNKLKRLLSKVEHFLVGISSPWQLWRGVNLQWCMLHENAFNLLTNCVLLVPIV